MATDPVCGMSVEPSEAPARIEHEGVTYYFCCQACRDAFQAQPEQYIGAEAPGGTHGGGHGGHEH